MATRSDMRNPTDTDGIEADRIAEEQARQLKFRQETEDIKWLMAHKQGRRIVYRLFELTGVHRTSFNTNSMVTSFNEGQRNVGLKLLEDVTIACPEQYVLTLKEGKQ